MEQAREFTNQKAPKLIRPMSKSAHPRWVYSGGYAGYGANACSRGKFLTGITEVISSSGVSMILELILQSSNVGVQNTMRSWKEKNHIL